MKRILAFALLCCIAVPARAQLVIPGAGGGKIGILSGGTSIGLDVTEAKLSINLSSSSHLTAENDCDDEPTQEKRVECMKRVLDEENRFFVEGTMALAAQKGQRSLLAGGEITPGVEAGLIGGWMFERSHSGYWYPYLGVVGNTRSLETVEFAVEGEDATELNSEVEKALGFTAGINLALRENLLFGVSHTGSRNWSTPGIQSPSEVCVVQKSGIDRDENVVEVSACSERYEGPLENDYTTQTRVEILKNFSNFDGESFGILGGLSMNTRSTPGASSSFNLSIGPVLHPEGKPHQTLLAVLFAFTDFTDANNNQLEFRDIFSVQLYLSIPLTGF